MTHWTQVGQQRLGSGELLLYSRYGEENSPHTQGFALMLSKQAQNALIGWEFMGQGSSKAPSEQRKRAFQWTSFNAMRLPKTTMKTLKTNSTIGCNQSSRSVQPRT
ncbi:unnamed protein product [Schistosoma margrebowiei]|uniref:Uncharacterized protein n=1 Tax=Schistosoma margrebowiei TaxID=48269 RepID=A0A183M316_9TREM|nr:unnamed protein product [Schistosoma margrebowiei]